jgi:hypothetical protein
MNKRDASNTLEAQVLAMHTEPRAGFVDKLINVAVQRGERSRRVRLASMAAVACIAFAAGLLLAPAFTDTALDVYQVAVTPYEEEMVDIIVNSAADRESATLTIELADNVQLKGFPDERVLSWQTSLRAGKNLLSLPIILTDDQGAQFNVGMRYGDTDKAIRVMVLADSDMSPKQV